MFRKSKTSKFLLLSLLIIWLLPVCKIFAQSSEEKIIAKEKGLLDRWKQGDTFGFAEAADTGITYFDPTLAERKDGIEKFRNYLSPFNGTISFPLMNYLILNYRCSVIPVF